MSILSTITMDFRNTHHIDHTYVGRINVEYHTRTQCITGAL